MLHTKNSPLLDRVLARLTGPKATILLGKAVFRLLGLPREAPPLPEVKSALVLRLDEIGDVVLMSPFLRELRRNLPKAWISLVVKPSVFNLVELCPYVDEVLTYNWSPQGRWTQLVRQWRALRLSRKKLWERRFDLAISPRCGVDYYHAAKLMFLSGAPWRVGWSEETVSPAGEPRHNLDRLVTHLLKTRLVKHQVELNLDVIRSIGGVVKETQLEFWLSEQDDAFADRLLGGKKCAADAPLVAFGVGAGAGRKQWPIQRFAELGRWLRTTFGFRCLIVGSEHDELAGKTLESSLGDTALDLTGKATLRQTSACLKRCSLFIGNDSGPMHLAAAVKVPIIEVSWHSKSSSSSFPNGPLLFGPWGVPHRIARPERPLAPCHDECESKTPHCILGVSVEHVQQAVRELFPANVI